MFGGVGFRASALEEITDRLCKMSEEERINHGKRLMEFCKPDARRRVEPTWAVHLNEARSNGVEGIRLRQEND